MMSNNEKKSAIILAPAWPGITGGYSIAIRASLLLYTECFDDIYFIGVTDKPYEPNAEWSSKKIKWAYIPIKTSALWVRFVKSLISPLPALTVRYYQAREEVMRILGNALNEFNKAQFLIIEDMPMACFLPNILAEFPELPIALRSHDVLVKAYGPLSRVGSPIHRMAWRYETARIQRFEKKFCEQVDAVWAISQDDADEYTKKLSVRVDGVIGVCLDVERYRKLESGDTKTIVSVCTADLRKGNSLLDFIRQVWPKILAEFPEARLVLAGRGTERFDDARIRVEGLGYIDDDREILKKGLIFINPQKIGSGVQIKSIVAMLAGKTLVSTEIGAEGIEGNNNKHFIVSESSELMASQIISLMRNPENALDIAQRARTMATNHYSDKQFIKDNIYLLTSFINKR